MRIIDTHCHLVYPDRLRYPWLDSVPALNHPFPVEAYRRQAEQAGITDTIHMEVDVAEADMAAETKMVTALDGIAAVIAACRPEHAGFPAYVEQAAANPKLKGFRRVLHTEPDDLAAAPGFAENVARLAAYGFTFDLCALPRQLPVVAGLARRCPDVQFILDHCGIPDVKAGALDPWRDHITAIAALPNVACKISGVVAYADPAGWTVDDLRPFVEHCIEAFGFDRVVWGSDWPVCTLTADLVRWVAATHALVAGASDDEKARLFGLNAERIYGLA
ncbi:MAG: amidohydrolase family protein [Bauldia sp.]|nr:MAG: amidohydrolase family protein [Bauldia sp.]